MKNYGDLFNPHFEKEQNEAEKKRQKLDRFVSFFGRVNSTLTFRKVTVKVENSSIEAPAWSGANEIVFNSRLLGDLNTPKEIAGIRGLDLHEISHILYTPRNGSELGDYVIENKLWFAYNILEDQRIESLFTTRFPSTVEWFTATILIHFVENPEAWKTSYPLLRGRRYLPADIREKSRLVYPEQDKIADICRIIDEYRTLLFPADTERAKELIKEFSELLPKQDGGSGEGENKGEGDGKGSGTITVKVIGKDPFGHGERPHEGIESSVNSRPLNPKQQVRDRDRMKSLDKPDDLEITIDLSDISENSSDNKSENKSENKSTDKSNSAGDTDSPVSDVLNDMLNDILSDEKIATEINDIIRQIGGLPSLATNNSTQPEQVDYHSLSVDMKTAQASVKFAREIERLRSTFDPFWEKYQSQGRINVERYIRGDELDTIFDRFNEGIEDATEIECVIALDRSGSMSGSKSASAYQAMYAIKKALDRINANTTVLTFNHESQTLYTSGDRATNVIRNAGVSGGTDPDHAIKYATKLLAESKKPVRIFFAITDGEWGGNANDHHEAIKRMGRAGVLTSFAYIADQSEQVDLNVAENRHFCEIGATINNPLDLITMAKSIVKFAITRRLVNR